jgi:hypothetical protein
MQCLDKICLIICNKICFITKILCIPAKLTCRIFTTYFDRPYSLCFLLNFFILISPSLLLIVMLSQYSQNIYSLDKFNMIFYSVLINLILNFVSVFYIYDLYERHSLNEVKLLRTVSSFIKLTWNYLFIETKAGYLGIYYILQVGVNFTSLLYIFKNSEYNSEKFETPVLIFFTKFALICCLAFTLAHIILYTSLFFVILCSINNSCLCGLCLTRNGSDKSVNPISNRVDKGSKNVTRENTQKYFLVILECYKFLRLYDYKRLLELEYIETKIQFDSNNEV